MKWHHVHVILSQKSMLSFRTSSVPIDAGHYNKLKSCRKIDSSLFFFLNLDEIISYVVEFTIISFSQIILIFAPIGTTLSTKKKEKRKEKKIETADIILGL